ncbi:MAG: hypothetical protein ABI999_02885 [Acidobacteriota bacterium]
MRFRNYLVLVAILIGISGVSRADIPPEPGSTRVYLSLILDPRGDLSDFRFFVESGMKLEEVKLTDRQQQTIDPKGGGARYNSATVYAVPMKSLGAVKGEPTEGELASLDSALNAKSVDGALDLVHHQFSQDVPKADADSYLNPVYRIAKDEQGVLRAVRADDLVVGRVAPFQKDETPTQTAGQNRITIVAAGAIVIAVLFGGLWLLRRKLS